MVIRTVSLRISILTHHRFVGCLNTFDSSLLLEYVSLPLCKDRLSFLQFFAKKITQACMPGTVEKRNSECISKECFLYISHNVVACLSEAQADAETYKKQIEEANLAQQGLANMQTQFAALDSEFQSEINHLVPF